MVSFIASLDKECLKYSFDNLQDAIQMVANLAIDGWQICNFVDLITPTGY